MAQGSPHADPLSLITSNGYDNELWLLQEYNNIPNISNGYPHSKEVLMRVPAVVSKVSKVKILIRNYKSNFLNTKQ